MNVRERFLAMCRFEKPDRPIRYEGWGFWPETYARWHTEGLPETVCDHVFSAPAHFGYDPLTWLPIAAADVEPGFCPRFDEDVLEETETYVTKRDGAGKTVRIFTDGRSTLPQELEWPVKTLHDYEDLAWRLDPESPERFTSILDVFISMANSLGDNNYTTSYVCGLFGTYRHLMGLVGMSVAIRRDPALLHTIARRWVELNATMLIKVREKVPMDRVFFWEDMSYKNGPMISPKVFREFMTPYYTQLIDRVKAETDITVFSVDSDGNLDILIPLFMETGINMLSPFEVQAGMDIRKVRERYPDLIIFGGLDKRALAEDEAAIRREVMDKVPFMLERRGYIPGLDHWTQPEVSLKNFMTFLEIVRGLPA